ncbi:hypothetical protein NMY22_g17361 [Coprinellus aureogranulatus]|nr:hypothetical protein NMY22_g17361 [Coprinellus aureogranulatus]
MDSQDPQGSKTTINNRNVYQDAAKHFQASNGGHIVHGGDNMNVYLNGQSENGGTRERDGKGDEPRRMARAYDRRTDIFSLLNPIPDASYTRDRKRSGPDSSCFPGTRKKVLKKIRSWANSSLFLANPHIMWVYGYAGCGKSAIAQAIAEHFSGENRLAASFSSFAAPESEVGLQVRANPALISASTVLHIQFERLVYIPINDVKWDRLAASLRHGPFLIVLDGLDECNDRDDVADFIEHTISFFDKKPRIPLRILITSRVENHIYERLHSSKQVQLLNLVDFTSDDDISAALDVAIANAKCNRVVACEESWPPLEDKAKLVKHIGGSYIFMTTIIKFLFDPALNNGQTPMERLPLVLGLRPDFDGLYTTILTASQHLPHFQQVVSTIALVCEPMSVAHLASLLAIPAANVANILVSLHAIMHVPGDDRTPVTLWHTSLRDFLCTEIRSGLFYASPTHHRQIAYQCISSAASPTGSPGSLPVDYSRRFAMEHWLAFVQSIGDSAGAFGAEISSFIEHLKLYFPESYNTILHTYLQLQVGQPTGTTLLDVAARCQNWADLELILKPNVNVKLVRPSTSLMLYPQSHSDHPSQTVDKHSDDKPAVVDESARSVLEEACLSMNWGLVRDLISNSPHTVNIRFKDVQENNIVTALHTACHHREYGLIYFLLENGVDPNISGELNPVAHLAKVLSSLMQVPTLANHSFDFFYGTPLNFASYKGDIKLVTRLLECGANPNLQGGYYGTAVQAACHTEKPKVVNLLLEHGADPNLIGGWDDQSALHACAWGGHVHCARALLEHKADPNLRNKYGDTPLHYACINGHTKMAELLLDFGADSTIRDNKGKTALQQAITSFWNRDDRDILVRMLRRRGVTG